MQLTLELPEDIAAQLSAARQDLQRDALEAFALEQYRAHRLTTGQVRRLLGHGTRMQTHAFLKEHGVFLHYDENSLKEDLEAFRD
jgi:predicted HTH domain antitoxin